MIQKPVHRYSILDAGALCRLFRSDGIFWAAGDDFADISKLACFVENNLRSPHVFIMGIDPRYEAFIFIPMHTTSCYVGHFVIRKDHRGKDSMRHLVESAGYVFKNSPCRALMGFIREENKPACMLAGHVGMKRIGKTDGTLKFGGEMVDEIIYQCTLEDWNIKYGDKLGRI